MTLGSGEIVTSQGDACIIFKKLSCTLLHTEASVLNFSVRVGQQNIYICHHTLRKPVRETQTR